MVLTPPGISTEQLHCMITMEFLVFPSKSYWLPIRFDYVLRNTGWKDLQTFYICYTYSKDLENRSPDGQQLANSGCKRPKGTFADSTGNQCNGWLLS